MRAKMLSGLISMFLIPFAGIAQITLLDSASSVPAFNSTEVVYPCSMLSSYAGYWDMPISGSVNAKIYDFTNAICDQTDQSIVYYLPSSGATTNMKVEQHQGAVVTVLGEYMVTVDSVTNLTNTNQIVNVHFPFDSFDNQTWGDYIFNGAQTLQEFRNFYYGFGTLLVPGDTIENVVEIRTINNISGKKSWQLFRYDNLVTPIASWKEGGSFSPTEIVPFDYFPSRVSALGLTENSSVQSLKLFPNPTNDMLNLVIPFSGKSFIRLFDNTGSMVSMQQHVGAGVTRIDVTHLKSGIYQVELRMDDLVQRGRVSIGK